MKILYKLLTLSLLFGVITSCEEKNNVYEGQSFAMYEKTYYSATESSGEIIEVPVFLNIANGKHDSKVTVAYTITSDTGVEGVNYVIIDDKSEFSFEPGVYKDAIKVQIIDNTDEDGDKVLDIAITTSSNTSINIGTPGPTPTLKNTTLVIIDDDCALKINEFVGTPAGVEWWGWSPILQVGSGPYSNGINFTLVDTPDNIEDKLGHYMAENFGNSGMVAEWGETTTTTYPIKMVLDYTDPTTPTVMFETNPDAEIRPYHGVLGDQDVQVLNITLDGEYAYGMIYTQSDKDLSTFSTCNNTLHFEYSWVVAFGTGDFQDFGGGDGMWPKAVDITFE